MFFWEGYSQYVVIGNANITDVSRVIKEKCSIINISNVFEKNGYQICPVNVNDVKSSCGNPEYFEADIIMYGGDWLLSECSNVLEIMMVILLTLFLNQNKTEYKFFLC